MNPSLSILHPTEAAGKKPYWLSSPKREEPSRRRVTAAKYLSLIIIINTSEIVKTNYCLLIHLQRLYYLYLHLR